MKPCNICGINIEKPHYPKFGWLCIICARKKGNEYHKRWLAKNPEYNKKYQRENYKNPNGFHKIRIKENRERVKEEKTKPCKDCGNKYPYYVMDLDHIIGDKKENISFMLRHASSKETLELELAKCEVICSNCHRERTYQRKQAKIRLEN